MCRIWAVRTAAYSAISVTDGATLTVAATRDIPAITLDAGTAIRVAVTDGNRLESQIRYGWEIKY